MFDRYVRPLIDPPLNKVANIFVKRNISANSLTATGFVFALICFGALTVQAYGVAVFFIALSRLMDGLDGAVARRTMPTNLGGYYDIVSDFIFYAGSVFFFGLGQYMDGNHHAMLPAAFLIFSFIGASSSFLAYAIIAAKKGVSDDGKQGKKSFFYLGGLTEGSETIFTLVLICLLPQGFAYIAYIFGVLCWITTISRVLQARHNFKS